MTTLPVVLPEVLDEDDLAFYAKKFDQQEARKYVHLFDWVAQERGMDGPSHTICDRWLTLRRTATLADVKCPDCISILADRMEKENA